jgi:uncharacterized membrane protein SirB2
LFEQACWSSIHRLGNSIIVCVILSGVLFVVRALAALAGARWPMAALVGYLSYAIDSSLLTAALMLLTILPSAVFANGCLRS